MINHITLEMTCFGPAEFVLTLFHFLYPAFFLSTPAYLPFPEAQE